MIKATTWIMTTVAGQKTEICSEIEGITTYSHLETHLQEVVNEAAKRSECGRAAAKGWIIDSTRFGCSYMVFKSAFTSPDRLKPLLLDVSPNRQGVLTERFRCGCCGCITIKCHGGFKCMRGACLQRRIVMPLSSAGNYAPSAITRTAITDIQSATRPPCRAIIIDPNAAMEKYRCIR